MSEKNQNPNIVLFDREAPVASANPTAAQRRALLLGQASEVELVDSPEVQAIAVAVCSDLQREMKETEAARKSILTPYLSLTRFVNATAEAHVGGLDREYRRITQAIGAFQATERERVAREEQLRKEAADRLARAESDAAAAAEKALVELNKAGAGEAELAKAVEAETAAVVAANAFVRAVVAPPPAVIRETGMSVKPTVCWEVTNMHDLYAHNKSLVRLEPNKAAINAIVAVGVEIPGLKIWTETKVSVRA